MKGPVVCFGELMLRLNTPSHQRFSQTEFWESYYGGSEANVSVLLARLGTTSAFVTSLPKNDLGQSAVDALRKHGVDTRHIIRNEGRLGLYFTETSNALRPSRVIYDRTDSAFAKITPGEIPWKTIFRDAGWFHWSGISAATSATAPAICLEALKAAKKAGLFISADMNYRSQLWKFGKQPSKVMPELLSYCDLITGDIDTAGTYFGIKTKSSGKEGALKDCGKQLRARLPHLKWLAMTFRESDAAGTLTYSGVLMDNHSLYFSTAHTFGNIIERIGTGDAFMGGLIHALAEGLTGKQAIDFAVASGALKHSIPGEFALVTKDEIKNFMNTGDAKGKIIR